MEMTTKSKAIREALRYLQFIKPDTGIDRASTLATISQAWSAIAALLPDDDADTTSEGE